MRRACFLVLLLALSACSGGSQWNKPGADPQIVRADLRDCESEARALTRQDENIDNDIMATRGQDWQRTGTLGAKRETLALQNQGRSGNIVEQCMRAKGYSNEPPPKAPAAVKNP